MRVRLAEGDGMDAVVTARVPVEVKEQGNAILKSIGSSPTELVNAAYEYVMRHKSLPRDEKVEPGVRTLTAEQWDELRSEMDSMTFAVPESFWEGRSYKDIIAEGRWADYEALA